jgi:hypothetical protein
MLDVAVGSIDFLTVDERDAAILVVEETIEWVEFLTELHILAGESLLGINESLLFRRFLFS